LASATARAEKDVTWSQAFVRGEQIGRDDIKIE
jgi:hypothetical protein